MSRFLTELFGFKIRTRAGVIVENLLVFGLDGEDATRRLRQIYKGCEVLEMKCFAALAPFPAAILPEPVFGLVGASAENAIGLG